MAVLSFSQSFVFSLGPGLDWLELGLELFPRVFSRSHRTILFGVSALDFLARLTGAHCSFAISLFPLFVLENSTDVDVEHSFFLVIRLFLPQDYKVGLKDASKSLQNDQQFN